MKLRLISKFTEAGDIVSFRFQTNEPFEWRAGQYMRFTLRISGKEESHWFTIASAPFEKQIMITTHVRPKSDYKQTLNALKIGEEIEATSLDGDFVWRDNDIPKVFIAGGIGVTPVHSILKEHVHTHSSIPVVLLYATTSDDIAYKTEFDKLVIEHPEFNVSYLVGERLTAEIIQKHIPNIIESFVYLSGPDPMVDAVASDLQKIGVQDHNLMRDGFEGYEINS